LGSFPVDLEHYDFKVIIDRASNGQDELANELQKKVLEETGPEVTTSS
jgi:hypothetical protein